MPLSCLNVGPSEAVLEYPCLCRKVASDSDFNCPASTNSKYLEPDPGLPAVATEERGDPKEGGVADISQWSCEATNIASFGAAN